MRIRLRELLCATVLVAFSSVVSAQTPTIRIGVLNDMSGPFADLSGRNSVVAAQMAADDFAKEAGPGAPKVEIVGADHQNKADVGLGIVRKWVEQDNVAAVVDVPNSAVALAVNSLLKDKDRAFLASSTATSDLTGSQCAPTTVQWTFDTWALSNGTARALLKAGADTWYFITSDYAFGKALEGDATRVVTSLNGKILGTSRLPLNTADYSSALLQAQNSGAKVIALANAGADTTTSIKQATEFGIGKDGRQRLAGLLVFLTDVDSMGLNDAKGLLLTEAFYWDLNDKTRAWSKRFGERAGGRMPTMNHAGVYSSVLAYLRAAKDLKGWTGAPSGSAVVARMEEAPINDELFGPTTIRKDGRAVHDMYLFQVKTPAESKARWDYYKVAATIPAAEAFRPINEGGCSLVK